VLLINDSLSSGVTVNVQAPAGYGSAPSSRRGAERPERLCDELHHPRRRSFGTETSSGALQPPIADAVRRRAGSYRVRLPPATRYFSPSAAPDGASR